MARNSIRDYSNVNSSNTDIQSIDISEGCSPAGINNAIREVMADLKDVSTGAVALESPAADSLTVTGDLTVDTNTLYVDSTNNNVGIATSSPSSYYSQADNLVVGQTGDTGMTIASGTSNQGSIMFSDGTSGSDLFRGQIRYNHVSNYMMFATDAAERLRIDNSGNVGIGTSSPNMPLHISNSTDGNLVNLYTTGTGGSAAQLTITGASNLIKMTTGGTDALAFETSGSNERMRIDSSGNLLLQKTSATNSGAGTYFEVPSAPTTMPVYLHFCKTFSGIRDAIDFNHNGSRVGSIQFNDTSTSYNTSSDYRLKTAVEYDWDATTRLKQLKPARFEWIADGDDAVPVDGFLAHEVQTIVPEAVVGTKDAMMNEEYEVSAATGDIYTPAIEAVLDEDGNEVTPAVAEVIHSTDVERPEELAEGQQWRETTAAVMGTRSVPDYQGIDQSKLVPLLVKTIQELEARITALEAN